MFQHTRRQVELFEMHFSQCFSPSCNCVLFYFSYETSMAEEQDGMKGTEF